MKYIPIDIVSRLEFCVDFISEVCLGGIFHGNYPLLQTRGFVRRSVVVDLYTSKLAPTDARNEFYTKFQPRDNAATIMFHDYGFRMSQPIVARVTTQLSKLS